MDPVQAALLAAIGTLWAALLSLAGFAWRQSSKRADECCMERDIHRKANDEALSAFRRRDDEARQKTDEERRWRWEREQGSPPDPRLRPGGPA